MIHPLFLLLAFTVISVDIKVSCGDNLTLQDKKEMEIGIFECPLREEEQ